MKTPPRWPLFSSIFGKVMGQALLGHFLGGSTITIITPMRQARICGQDRAPGTTPSAPKQWKSDVQLNPCQREITRAVARFPHGSQSRPAATAADSETPCVWRLGLHRPRSGKEQRNSKACGPSTHQSVRPPDGPLRRSRKRRSSTAEPQLKRLPHPYFIEGCSPHLDSNHSNLP